MGTTTPNYALHKPTPDEEHDWGYRWNENADVLDTTLTANADAIVVNTSGITANTANIGTRVLRAGDTMTGELIAPSGTFSESLTVSGEPVATGAHTSDHSLLSNLDYSSAGHTGFASTVDTNALAASGIATDENIVAVSGHLSQEIDDDITTHAAISTAHHTKYTDAEAVIALEPTTSELAASGVTTDEQVTTNYTAFLSASGTLVKKTGDTMTGELIAPTVTVSESLTISGSPVCTGIPYVRDITVEVPGEDEDLTYFYTDEQLTVEKMQAVVVGSGASFGVTWSVRSDAARWETGTELVTGGTTTTNSGVGDTITSFDNPTIPANSWCWLETTAFTPTVNLLTISLKGRRS